MKNLLTIILALAIPVGAQAADCYSDSLMTYVENRQLNAKTDRWVRIEAALRDEEGAMPLAEAEQILANRKRMRLNLEHMDEVVAAIKCIAAPPEPEPEVEVVVVDPEPAAPANPNPAPPPAWPDPKPQEDAQDQSPAVTKNFKVYWHGGTMAASNVDWRISEDDHWKSKVIVHLDLPSSVTTSDATTKFCVGGDVLDGMDYWHRGPFRMSGMTDFYGLYACTDTIDNSSSVSRESITGGNRLVYEGTILTRDNNVVEPPLDIGALVFAFGIAGNRDAHGITSSVTTTHHIPATTTTYRALDPSHVANGGEGWWFWNTTNGTPVSRISPGQSLTCGTLADLNGFHDGRFACLGSNTRCTKSNPDNWQPVRDAVGCRVLGTTTIDKPLTSIESFAHSENRLPVIVNEDLLQIALKPHTRVGNDYTKVDLMVYRNHVGPFKIQYTAQGGPVITHEHAGGQQRWTYATGVGSRTTAYSNGSEARRDKVRTITVACGNGSGWLEARGAEGTQATTSRVQICYP